MKIDKTRLIGGSSTGLQIPADASDDTPKMPGQLVMKGTALLKGNASGLWDTVLDLHPIPVADFAAALALRTVTFTNLSTSSQPLTYLWEFGDNTTSTATNPVHSFAVGTFSVKLTATDSYGTSASKISNVVVVDAPPVADFTYVVNSSAPSVAFTDKSTDADDAIVSRLWSFGDGTTSTATNVTHTFPARNTYTVSLKVTDAAGVSNTKTQSVKLGTPPVANYYVSVTDRTATVTDTSTDADGSIVSRVWNWGDGTSTTGNLTTASHTYDSDSTARSILLTATDNDGLTSVVGYSFAAATSVRTYVNNTVQNIPDGGSITSSIAISGRTGNANQRTGIRLRIKHANVNDLIVTLTAPLGSTYTPLNRAVAGTSTDFTYGVNFSNNPINGTWTLKVQDAAGNGLTGQLLGWALIT